MTPDEIAGGIDDEDKLAPEGRAVWASITWNPERIHSVEPHENVVDLALDLLQKNGYVVHSDDRHLVPYKLPGSFIRANWQVEIPEDDAEDLADEGGLIEAGYLLQAPWISVEIEVAHKENTPDYDDREIDEDIKHIAGIDDKDDLVSPSDDPYGTPICFFCDGEDNLAAVNVKVEDGSIHNELACGTCRDVYSRPDAYGIYGMAIGVAGPVAKPFLF